MCHGQTPSGHNHDICSQTGETTEVMVRCEPLATFTDRIQNFRSLIKSDNLKAGCLTCILLLPWLLLLRRGQFRDIFYLGIRQDTPLIRRYNQSPGAFLILGHRYPHLDGVRENRNFPSDYIVFLSVSD